MKFLLNLGGQTIDSIPEICIPTGNEDPIRMQILIQHDFIARSMASTVHSSAPL